MSSAIDLVVLNGPLEGEVIQLRPQGRTRLGRAKGGVQIPDLLVSMKHAEITFAGDHYWIEDTGSVTGTFVDGERLSGRSHALQPGMRLQLGETELEVRERPRSSGLRVAGAMAAVVILLVGVRAFMDSVEVSYDPTIRWFEPIRMGSDLSSPDLVIPTPFIRETGVDHRELSILRVSDHDANGVDEVWLRLPSEERLITFDVEGNWVTLGVLPTGCRERSSDVGFPDLDCHGARWTFRGGGYELASMDGVVVWATPVEVPKTPSGEPKPDAKPKLTDGPPRPHVVSLVRPEMLAGFLAKRGVSEAIQYLICEDAIAGLRAQVRTAAGEIVPLSLPCLRDVSLEGVDLDRIFGDGIPRMVAFTAHGHRALLDDLATHLGGEPTGLAVGRDRRPLWDAVRQSPVVRRGAFRLSFDGDERLFAPVGPERAPPSGVASLARTEGAPAPPAPVSIARIDGPSRIPVDGCGSLVVQSGPWHCLMAKGCSAGSTLLRVTNEACGDGRPVDIPYARGQHRYDDGALRGYVIVDSIDGGRQIDVLRTRLVYQKP